MTMTAQELEVALAARGIDNPQSLVEAHDNDVVERSIAFWDRKRRVTQVGAGLLVQVIRRGGPTLAEAPAPAPGAAAQAPGNVWREWAREHFADILDRWPYAIHILAWRASSLACGGWDVTPELVREWWDQSWWAKDLEANPR